MTAKSNELVRAVSIGEGVKHIIRIAIRVRSIATNAILLAHRAGELARGFGVLSNELRGFTNQVTAQMDALSDVTFRLVGEVSVQLRLSHRTQLLRRAHAILPADATAATRLATVLSRHAEDSAIRTKTIERLHRELEITMNATDQLGQFGTVLARTALIEAAYGGEHSVALSGVAQEFNQTILQIIDAMRDARQAFHSSINPEATLSP